MQKLRFLSWILALIIVQLSAVTSLAYSTNPTAGSEYRLYGGISDRQYYISTDYRTTPYSSAFSTAMNNWCSDSDASFTQTTTYWDSCIDMKTYDNGEDNVNGYTIYWVGDGAGGNNNVKYTSNKSVPTDWWCSETYLSRHYTSSSRTAKAAEIMAHEIGHAFGFTENNSEPESIMCQAKYGRTATVPHGRDKSALNRLYRF